MSGSHRGGKIFAKSPLCEIAGVQEVRDSARSYTEEVSVHMRAMAWRSALCRQ